MRGSEERASRRGEKRKRIIKKTPSFNGGIACIDGLGDGELLRRRGILDLGLGLEAGELELGIVGGGFPEIREVKCFGSILLQFPKLGLGF